jgi:ElaB/YqjD/DUF883 family membrane-anchored ribosome-binding protein
MLMHPNTRQTIGASFQISPIDFANSHCGKETHMATMTNTETKHNEPKPSDSERRSGITEIKRDAHAVREDLDVLKEDTTQLAAHATSHAIDAVKSGAHSASELASNGGQKMREYHIAMNKQVRARPTTSVLLALGAGVMIGRVIAASRR